MASMIIATRLMEKSDCVLETIQNKIFKHVVKNHAVVFVPKPNQTVCLIGMLGPQENNKSSVVLYMILRMSLYRCSRMKRTIHRQQVNLADLLMLSMQLVRSDPRLLKQ